MVWLSICFLCLTFKCYETMAVVRSDIFSQKLPTGKNKKMIKSDPKTRFFHFLKNFAIYFCWKCPLIKIYAVIYLTVQIPYLGKFLLFSYNLKGFQPISLQDSLITNTSPVWMTGSHWFFACRQTVKTGKGFNSIFYRVWSGMPKAAQNSSRPSKASQKLGFHWK